MRTVSHPPDDDQSGISLWTLEDIEKQQAKQKEQAKLVEQAQAEAAAKEEYGDGGMDDELLMDLDI